MSGETAANNETITISDPEKFIADKREQHSKGGRPTDAVRLAQGKRKLQPAKGWWPEEKWIEVATLYAAGLHKVPEISELAGVPVQTIRNWMQSEKWFEVLDRINVEKDVQTVSRFNQIMDKALDVIVDRLENGESFYDPKSGEVKRRPVSLRDATVAGAIIVDKRQLLRGKATSRTEKVEVSDRLSQLAKDFQRFIEAKEINHDQVSRKREIRGDESHGNETIIEADIISSGEAEASGN